jgi:diacylglycerol kinase (ATP)
VLVVANDLAGRAQQDAIKVVADELSREESVEVVECEEPAQIDEVLDRRAGRRLILLGGDGSLNTMLTFLWRRGEAADCPIGLVPLGTGNDFARGAGIPLDPVEAARLAATGVPRPIDLITDDAGGVVVNAMHVGVGADAAVSARPLKPYLKSAAFPLGAVVAGARARGWRLRVEVDGRPIASGRRRVLMAGLANAPTIAGGTATLAPDASVTDGHFDVVVSTAVGPLARIGYAVGLVRGTHADRADVVRRPGRTLTISGEPYYVNADGDISGPVRRRTWTVRPGAWNCVLPSPAHATAA